MPPIKDRSIDKCSSNILPISRSKSNNKNKKRKLNSFINRKLDLSFIGKKKTKKNECDSVKSVEYLHFKEEVSNYGHLSDSPLPITPWYSLEEFEEITKIIYESVYEAPKIHPPEREPERLYELFVKPDDRDKIVFARLKVRTWKLRSMNIDDGQFLTEFLCCLERLLNYLIAKSFQRRRLGLFLYEMKTMVITGFITSLESTLSKQSYCHLGRSLSASKLFSCPRWILQIRHKLSHSNTLISNDILEDAISFIFAWFRKNFEFHLIKMPSDSYEDDKEFYQHRSFSNSVFSHIKFRERLVDLFLGRIDCENDSILHDVRHFARFDLNLLLSFLVKIIDTIMFVKGETADFEYFAPTLMKIVKGIFMDTPSHMFCLKFLNKILDQILEYEKAIINDNYASHKNAFILRRDRLYKFIYKIVNTIIGKNPATKMKFFRIYISHRKSYIIRWRKFCFRLKGF